MAVCRNAHTRKLQRPTTRTWKIRPGEKGGRRPRPTPSGAPPLCGRAQAGANRFSGLTDTRFYPILSKPRLPSGDSKRRVACVSEGGSKANRTSPPAYDNRQPCRRQADNQWRDARAGFCWPHLLGPGVSRELADSSGSVGRGLEWRSLRTAAAGLGDVILSREEPRPAPPSSKPESAA